jgi:hypothetical protein
MARTPLAGGSVYRDFEQVPRARVLPSGDLFGFNAAEADGDLNGDGDPFLLFLVE